MLMVTSHTRGHLIVWIPNKSHWVYADTRESTEKERPCIRCNRPPTKEGHDACLGYIEGVSSACCGHGKEEEFIMRQVDKERQLEGEGWT